MNETVGLGIYDKKYFREIDPARLYFGSALFLLRPICYEDMQTLFSWRTDPNISQYLTASPPKDMEEQIRWYRKYQQDPGRLFFMTLKRSSEDTAIGYCQLDKIDTIKSAAEFGIVLGSEAFNNKAYGFKLTVTILKIAFSGLGIETIYGCVQPQNKVSCKFHTEYVGSELIEGPDEYRKENELLFKMKKTVFEAFEEKLLTRTAKWKDILDIEQVEV